MEKMLQQLVQIHHTASYLLVHQSGDPETLLTIPNTELDSYFTGTLKIQLAFRS